MLYKGQMASTESNCKIMKPINEILKSMILILNVQ